MLVDSDVLIWYLRGRPKAAQFLDALPTLQLSAVSYIELVQGMRNKRELELLKADLDQRRATLLPITEAISARDKEAEKMMQPKRFLRRPELIKKVGLGATSIYSLEREGKFPKHILLTPRCAVWEEAAVDSWMADRISAPAIGASVPSATRRANRLRSE